MARKYTDEALISHLRDLADDLGRVPTTADMDERGMCAANTYKRRFGSWNAALRAADLEVNRERDIDDVDLLHEIARLAGELGRPPIAEEMAERGRYSLTSYRNRFGSWGEALASAGYRTRGSRPRRSQNVDFLRENGPSTLAELPGDDVQVTDRMLGTAKFQVSVRSNGSEADSAGQSTPVYYLVDEHDREAVVRAFLAQNPEYATGRSARSLVRLVGRQGRSWKEPAKAVVPEFVDD